MALKEADTAMSEGEVPVGAILLGAQGEILARGHNRCVSSSDPSAHAEVLALREGGRALKNYRVGGAVLVVTLEPCMMCAGALVHSRIAGVVYGARDPKAGAVESCMDGLDQYFHNHRPWHMGGIMEGECSALLQDFFAKQR